MARLNQENRVKFENLFSMESGYVMDFSNRAFKDFVYKVIDVNIFDDKYMGVSGSKANRLRKLWDVESNSIVAKLNLKLLEYWKSKNASAGFELNDLHAECLRICDLLKHNSPELDPPKPKAPEPPPPIPETPKPQTPEPQTPEPQTPEPQIPEPQTPEPRPLEASSPVKEEPAQDFPRPESQRRQESREAQPLSQDPPAQQIKTTKPLIDDKDFQNLSKLIRDSIEKQEPQKAINQLHSFFGEYIRGICAKHKISYNENEPLIIFYGEYVKHLRAENKINSEMTERILSSSISVLEVFNKEWNSQSLTQKKLVLNYDESMLIIKSIAGIVDFIESIENG